jgi:hypothetical protein
MESTFSLRQTSSTRELIPDSLRSKSSAASPLLLRPDVGRGLRGAAGRGLRASTTRRSPPPWLTARSSSLVGFGISLVRLVETRRFSLLSLFVRWPPLPNRRLSNAPNPTAASLKTRGITSTRYGSKYVDRLCRHRGGARVASTEGRGGAGGGCSSCRRIEATEGVGPGDRGPWRTRVGFCGEAS